MTNFTDRVILRLNNTAQDYSPIDLVKATWWFQDGNWAPQGFNLQNVQSYLTLTEQSDSPPTEPNINLFEVTVNPDPILVVDRGFVVKKDISAGGFVGSNQGELWLGSGRNDQVDVPKIILTNASASRLGGGGLYGVPAIPSGTSFPTGVEGKVAVRTDSWNGNPANTVYKYDGSNWIPIGSTSDYAGYFDTLYLRQLLNVDGQWTTTTPGNMNLGKLEVQSTHSVFAVTAGDNGANQDTYLIPQNPSNGGLGLGTENFPFKWLDATSIFTNNIDYISGGIINVSGILNGDSAIYAYGGGVFYGTIAIGCAEFGSLSHPYETIQIYEGNNLRFNFGTTERARLNNTGLLVLPTQGSSGGLLIGSDTNLYWDSSNVLRTDDAFHAAGFKSSDGTDGVTEQVSVAKVGGGTRTLSFKNGLYVGYTDS